MSRIAVAVAVASIGVLASGCGTSREQQAKDTVCNARARIAEAVQEMAAMDKPFAAVQRVQGDLIAIGANLRRITDAEARLDPASRRRVTAAVEAFRSEATAITGTLLLGERLSVTGSNPKLRAALDRLASKYRRTLGMIDCG